MSAGFSGTFAANGVDLFAQPSNGNWVDKDSYGFDGNGRPLYPPVAEFDLDWNIMTTHELKQINDVFLYSQNTGSVVVDLPKWGDDDYLFYSYTGTYVSRPQVGSYFVGYVTNVKWTISNIRVS